MFLYTGYVKRYCGEGKIFNIALILDLKFLVLFMTDKYSRRY